MRVVDRLFSSPLHWRRSRHSYAGCWGPAQVLAHGAAGKPVEPEAARREPEAVARHGRAETALRAGPSPEGRAGPAVAVLRSAVAGTECESRLPAGVQASVPASPRAQAAA